MWWHDYVMLHAKNVIFIKGRLRFSRKGPAPFPSALVVFGRSGIADIEKMGFGEAAFVTGSQMI
jgi:hypothetical protein